MENQSIFKSQIFKAPSLPKTPPSSPKGGGTSNSPIEKVKLTANNIKSHLIKSNKDLKKIKNNKKRLFRKIEEKKKLKKKEKFIEKKSIGSGIGKIGSAIVKPVKGIFDRMMEFFGLIGIGMLISMLPRIIEEIKKIKKEIDKFLDSDLAKGIQETLGSVGNFFKGLGEFLGLFPEGEKEKRDTELKDAKEKLDSHLLKLEGIDSDIKKYTKDFEKITGVFKEEKEKIDKLSKNKNKSQPTTQQSTQQSTQPTVKPSTQPTVKPSVKSSTQPTSTQPTVKPQKFASGGVVQGKMSSSSSKPPYKPKPYNKVNQKNANNGFIKFVTSTNLASEFTEEQLKSIEGFHSLVKNLRELSTLESVVKELLETSPGGPSGGPPGPGGPSGSGGGGPHRVSSGMEKRNLAISPGWHMGIDIPASSGTKLYAFSSGVVQAVDYQSGYGNFIVWEDTAKGIENLYAHMLQPSHLNPGQKVKAGDVIGYVGNTGASTDPHLHWETSKLSTHRGATGGPKVPITNPGTIQARGARGRIDPRSVYNSNIELPFSSGTELFPNKGGNISSSVKTRNIGGGSSEEGNQTIILMRQRIIDEKILPVPV